MKQLWIILVGAVLISCTHPVSEWTVEANDLTSIKGLQDCTYHKLYTGNRYMHIVRCPNSTVTNNYSEGKSSSSVTTIDESTPVEELYKCSSNAVGELTCKKAE